MIRSLAFSWRRLSRDPGFVVIAALTLALGVGGTVAMYAVVDAVLLRPLDYEASEQLLQVLQTTADGTRSVAYPNYEDVAGRARTLSGAGVLTRWSETVTAGGPAERVSSAVISHGLLDLFGVRPVAGRGFGPQHDRAGGPAVVLIGAALWRERFNADPAIVGRSVRVSGEPRRVLGVVPSDLDYPLSGVQLWFPAGSLGAEDLANRAGSPGLRMIARMEAGSGLEAVRRELAGLAADLAVDYPGANEQLGFRVERLKDVEVGNVRRLLWLLLAAVGMVLLIASVNVASLFLARAASHNHDLAVRSALGARRHQLLGQAFSEVAIIAVLGGVGGLLLAGWSLEAIRWLGSAQVPRLELVAITPAVLLVALATVVIVAAVVGVTTAMRRAGVEAISALRSRVGADRSAGRLRAGLVVAQVALAFVVVAGAAFLVRTVDALVTADPGIDPTNVLTARIPLEQADYPEVRQKAAFYDALLERARSLPGVVAVGGAEPLPFSGRGRQWGVTPRDGQGTRLEETRTDVVHVDGDYFRAMGIAVLEGAVFDESTRGDYGLAVIDEEMARTFWPGESAVGKLIRQGDDGEWQRVIGVVENVRPYGVDQPFRQTLYRQFTPSPWLWGLTLTVKTTGSPGQLVPAIRAAVAELDANVPLVEVATMTDLVESTFASRRLTARVFTVFGALALTLALVGLYGLLAFRVTRRRAEIGVRMAVGASRADTVRRVLVDAVILAGAGIIPGTAFALLASHALAGLLYDVSSTDVLTYAAVAAVIIGVAALAAGGPARKAASVSPMDALQADL